MVVVMLICAFIFIGWLEIPKLLKKKHWNELATFLVLLLIGFTLNFLYIIDVKLPSPNKGIEYLIHFVQSAQK
jgi:predicted permease